MDKHGHSQEDDGIDVHYVPPQGLLRGVSKLFPQGFFLLFAQLGPCILQTAE